jgi:hypothetical protein
VNNEIQHKKKNVNNEIQHVHNNNFRSSPMPGYGSRRAGSRAGDTPQRIDKY